MARPYSAQGRYRLQYKRPAWKRVWNTSQCALGFHTCKRVDLIQILKCHTLKNIKRPRELCTCCVINQHSTISVDLGTSVHCEVFQTLFQAGRLYCKRYRLCAE